MQLCSEDYHWCAPLVNAFSLICCLRCLLTLLLRWWRSWAVSGSPAIYVLIYGIYQYHSLHSKHQPDATSSFVVYSCAKTRPFNLNDMPRYL